jgi:hypothetical protein
MPIIELNNVVLTNDVPVRTKYGVTHVLVFYDPKDVKIYTWKTTTLPSFEVNRIYNIMAMLTDSETGELSRVKELASTSVHSTERDGQHSEPESKPPVDLFNLIYNDTILTND